MRTHVKICCISSIEEARMAIKVGADALGLVGDMPSGPGIITNELIFQIMRAVPPPINTFLLTSETNTKKIIEHYMRVQTTTIQIVDVLKKGNYSDIRKKLPHVKVVQVIHVINEKTIDEALEISEQVDALLLDSGNPNLSVKELGGTGRVHNWSLSKKIVEQSKIPVFLAGGLNSENIRAAIESVKPYGVDLCSGVRTNGKLDERKLELFFQETKLL